MDCHGIPLTSAGESKPLLESAPGWYVPLCEPSLATPLSPVRTPSTRPASTSGELAGVSADDIAADYELSFDAERDEILAQAHTSARAVILDTLAGLDAEAYLRSGGLSQAELAALRARLMEDG